MKLRCFFGFHSWSKWEEVVTAIFFPAYQQRHCKHCGYIQRSVL